jgi:hypothetical protein
MKTMFQKQLFAYVLLLPVLCSTLRAQTGVGAKAPAKTAILFDGSRKMLDEKWTYWQGPAFAETMPIKWQVVADPVDKGTVLNTNDPASAGGKYGTADIVTKQVFKDFRLHIEFLVVHPGGNSGVYLQNRYEIQVLDGTVLPMAWPLLLTTQQRLTVLTMAPANGMLMISFSGQPALQTAH